MEYVDVGVQNMIEQTETNSPTGSASPIVYNELMINHNFSINENADVDRDIVTRLPLIPKKHDKLKHVPSESLATIAHHSNYNLP